MNETQISGDSCMHESETHAYYAAPPTHDDENDVAGDYEFETVEDV